MVSELEKAGAEHIRIIVDDGVYIVSIAMEEDVQVCAALARVRSTGAGPGLPERCSTFNVGRRRGCWTYIQRRRRCGLWRI